MQLFLWVGDDMTVIKSNIQEIQATATTQTGNVQGKVLQYADGKFQMVDDKGKPIDIEKIKRPEGICPVCGKTFPRGNPNQIYDSDKCRNLNNTHKFRGKCNNS
jgi:predicted nucleic acid-binding Zn ribbon protein